MAAASQDLVFRFLGIDAGAGPEFERMAGKATRFGSIGSKALLGVGAAAAVIAVESVKAASNFQASMELIHTQAGASQAEVNKLSTAVLGLAGQTATAPDELAKALYHLESTGLRGAAALDALRIAAEGAKVGQANLEDVTNALNAVIASGIKGSGDLGHAMGMLNATVGAGDMHMQDLADAMGTGLLVNARNFGVSLNEVGAALAVFGDNNIRGADAATQLRMSMNFLSKGTVTADAALGKVGLTSKRLSDDLANGGLNKAITDLHTHFQAAGITGSHVGQVIVEAFGKKAGSGIATLLTEFGRFQTKLIDVAEGAKTFQSDWQATTQTFKFHMEQIRAGAEAAAIYIGTYLIKALDVAFSAFGTVAHAVEATVGWFDQNKAAAGALAGVLTVALLPAILRTAAALTATAWESATAGMLKLANGTAGVIMQMTLLGGVVAVAAAAVGAGMVIAWERTAKAERDARKAADDYFTSLAVNGNNLDSMNAGLASLRGRIDDVRHAAIKSGDVTRYGLVGDKTQTQVDQLTSHLRTLSAQERQVAATEKVLGGAFGLSRRQVEALAAAHKIDLSKGLKASADAFAQVLDAANLSHHPLAQARADIRSMADKASTAADAVKALKDALDLLAGKALSADEAAISFANNVRALTKALHASHGSMRLNTQAGTDARQAFDQTAQSALDLSSSIKDSTGSTDKARASLRRSIGALKDTAGSSDYAKGAIARLQAAYAALGPAAVTATGKATAAVQQSAGAAEVAGQAVGAALADGVTYGMAFKQKLVEAQAFKLGKLAGMSVKAGARSSSPSKITLQVGKDIAEGLIQGWTGEAGRMKRLLSTDVENALNALSARVSRILSQQRAMLKAAQSKLKQDLASRASDTASLAGSIAGSADLSGAFSQDANGNTFLGNVAQFAAGQVGGLQRFAQDLAAARKAGLNPTDLAQIANMGSAQGDQILQQLLSSGSIGTLNSAQAQIAKYSGAAAATVEGSVYARQIARDRKNVHEQTVTLHKIERHLHQIERQAARDVARNVHITVDAKGRMKLTEEDGREIVRELRLLASKGIKP